MNVLSKEMEVRSGTELEYIALREEALRRTEQRQQLLSVLVALAAAFLGIGWGTGGAVALMIFPPMAALLALVWTQNEAHTHRITMYIRDELSQRLPGITWERYSRERMMRSRVAGFPLDMLAIAGIFIAAQMLAVLLAFFRFERGDLVQYVLLGVDFLSIALVIYLALVLRRLLLQ
jgi:hypothetical protein